MSSNVVNYGFNIPRSAWSKKRKRKKKKKTKRKGRKWKDDKGKQDLKSCLERDKVEIQNVSKNFFFFCFLHIIDRTVEQLMLSKVIRKR